MSVQVIPKERQARGQFNGGEIIENKPIGFPREGGFTRPYSNLFYWAYAEAMVDSTIGLHPHEGFEIMSFVLKDQIRHFDTKMNAWKPLQAGDAQIIRAGNGISHAEFMGQGSAMFQIWLDPDLNVSLKKPASYSDYAASDFPVQSEHGVEVKTYIGAGSPFQLDAAGVEIREYAFEKTDYKAAIDPEKVYSIYALSGGFTLNGEPVKADDFVLVKDAAALVLQSEQPGKFFLIASPGKVGYKTYAEIMQERMRGWA